MRRSYRTPLHAEVATALPAAILAAEQSVAAWARANGVGYRLAWQWTRGLCVPRRAADIAAVVRATGIPVAWFERYNEHATQPPWRTGSRRNRMLRIEHRDGCAGGLACRCFFGAHEIALVDAIDQLVLDIGNDLGER